MNQAMLSRIRSGLGAALLLALTGCVHTTRYQDADAPPPPDYVEGAVVVQDDYFYYPGYQVYYNSYRRQYIYQEGGGWVTRPTPGISVKVLFASPAVRLDFHDAPAFHHATVRRQYPEHWAPPAAKPQREKTRHNDGKGNHRRDS